MSLHVGEDTDEGSIQFAQSQEGAVVRPVLARVLPEPLRGIELRRVGWERFDFQPAAILPKPSPDRSVFVVRGIVLNQDGSALAIMGGNLMLQERQVGLRIEDVIPLIEEPASLKVDGPQNLDALAFPGHRHIGGVTDTPPCRMKSGILPKAGFIAEDQRPPFALGFFLRRG